MRITLFEWLLLPFVLWGVFQGALYYHANQVEEAIHIAMYEGSKKAAVQGQFTDDIYQDMLQYLERIHHFDPSKVDIKGTETITERGEYLHLEMSVPKPRMHVLPLFKVQSHHLFHFEKYMMSEYISEWGQS
ncbi:hypothetical protein [Caldalkalibacillus salinus]|uniref:hypothetical protein n=1 Tax=Caldalkalibacillus salinus TaxID=2803787 RepID=UPI0019237485|nr:hypothetical protein [Caldalkalibacillus salinus]